MFLLENKTKVNSTLHRQYFGTVCIIKYYKIFASSYGDNIYKLLTKCITKEKENSFRQNMPNLFARYCLKV